MAERFPRRSRSNEHGEASAGRAAPLGSTRDVLGLRGAECEEQRRVAGPRLVEQLRREAGGEERVEQGGECRVVDADPRADPVLRRIARDGVPAFLPVARVEEPRTLLARLDGGAAERRMDAAYTSVPPGRSTR
jgi:hypothetical protein